MKNTTRKKNKSIPLSTKSTVGNTALALCQPLPVADEKDDVKEFFKGNPKNKKAGKPISDIRKEADTETGEDEEKKDDTQAQRLAIIGAKSVLFKDLEGTAWARIPVKLHHEVYRVDSKEFETWLLGEYYVEYKNIPAQNTISGAKSVLQAKAIFEGETHEVFTRYAFKDECIYLDLCDADWRTVKITSTGWQVQAIPDVMFRRASKSLPLPEPLVGGTVDDLRPFLNGRLSDEEFVLIKAFVHGTMMPVGSFVLLDLEGEKGAGKSTMTTLLRSMFDPVKGALLPLPKSEQDLIIAANTSRVLSYDNLSGLSAGMSDALCRLSTGGGFAGRKLFTDGDEAIIDVKRPVIFNGIDSIATKPDLLDRCIVINLQEVGDSVRIDEETFWKNYESQRPYILGAFLTAASEALKNRSHIQLARMPRMADFMKWVIAAKDALKLKDSSGNHIDFAKVYGNNRAEATEIALEADALAGAIKMRLHAHGDFSGSPALVVRELQPHLDCKQVNMPTERTIRKRLLVLKPSLKTKGIEIEISTRTNAGYIISIKQSNRA